MTDQEISDALHAAQENATQARRIWSWAQYDENFRSVKESLERVVDAVNQSITQASAARDAILESLEGAKNL